MAKDMGKVYGEMLTKELVLLRNRHMAKIELLDVSQNRKNRKEAQRLNDLVAQIEKELAARVAQFWLKV